jgi:hypothetical protein
MYGPVLNVQRGKLPEAVDTKTENSFLSTHSDGSRSGLPLWGSWRTFSARSLPHRKEMREGRISPVMRDDLTASTLEQTSAPAESPAEQDGLGYIELLSFLPCMQDRAVLVSGGPLEGQMWETENILTQEMQRDPEKQNTLALTSYGVVLHEYHDDLKRAASILEQAVMGEPTCVEALNAYGAVLFELAQRANRDPRAVSVRDLIFDRSIQWGDRRSQKPNCYEALTKLQHKVLAPAPSIPGRPGKTLQSHACRCFGSRQRAEVRARMRAAFWKSGCPSQMKGG